jgi:predicted dinucleotide-binding enzyme
MLTVPLKAIPDLVRDLAAGPRRDGRPRHRERLRKTRRADRARRERPSARGEWAAAMFPRARWVKAFNRVYFKVLETESHRERDQVGIPLAGDDRDALELAAPLCATPDSIP